MVAYSRLFLVLILALLQFAAPLVHAHVEDGGGKRGLHLHEFEHLRVKAKPAVGKRMASLHAVQSAVVDMGLAIRATQTAEQPDMAVALLWGDFGWALPRQRVLDIVNFSPHEAGKPGKPYLFQHPCRAPPV